MSNKGNPGKGEKAEEVLRRYFLELGYFVVRAVKFDYEGQEVTDVDLWIYHRPSTLTRERANVDVRLRRVPQAIERIFWTRGLQLALGLERSIVATKDRRPSVRSFGRRMGVVLIGGDFLDRLRKRHKNQDERLPEEQFPSAEICAGKGETEKDWRTRLKTAKGRLLGQLDYSACNAWLADSKFFAEQVIVDQKRRDAATRLFYLVVSFFLVGLDFVLKDISLLEPAARDRELLEGLRHGSMGGEGTKRVVSMAKKLVAAYAPNGGNVAAGLERNVASTFEAIPAEILQEFFARPENARSLFVNAKKFEGHAFARKLSVPGDLETDLQSVLGVTLDFMEIERRRFFEAFDGGQRELPIGSASKEEEKKNG